MQDLNLEMLILRTVIDQLELAYKIRPTDFYYPVHKFISGVLVTLAVTQPKIEPDAIYSAILATPHPNLKTDELSSTLEVLKKFKSSSGTFTQDVAQLKKLAQMRDLQNAVNEANKFLDFGDYDSAKTSLHSTLVKLGEDETSKVSTVTTELVSELFPEKAEIFIPTGFKEIDDNMGGFGNQELIILAADSGSGKSTLMQIMSINMIEENYYPVYFNLEMSPKHWFSRFYSHVSEIPHKDITLQPHSLSRDQLDKLYSGLINLYGYDDAAKTFLNNFYKQHQFLFKDLNTFYDEARRLEKFRNNDTIVISSNVSSVADIFQQASSLKKQGKCDIVFVDYINLLMNQTTRMTTAEKLSQIALELKTLSKTLNIPVVCAAQWNRNENDVKYSKAIRETADTLFTWKELPSQSLDSRDFAFYSVKSRNAEPLSPRKMRAEFTRMVIEISSETIAKETIPW